MNINRNGSEMVGVLASSMVDHGWEIKQVNIHIIHIGSVMASVLASGRSWLSSKEYKISIYYFSTKHRALWNKNKDWLARKKDNESEWSDMSTRVVVSKSYEIQLIMLV